MAESDKKALEKNQSGTKKQDTESKPQPKVDKNKSKEKSSDLKRFKLVFEFYAFLRFEIADIDDDAVLDDETWEDITDEYDLDYVGGAIALGDEWGENPNTRQKEFHLTVYDANSGKVVYESDDKYDFHHVFCPVDNEDLLADSDFNGDVDSPEGQKRIKELRNKIDFDKIEQSYSIEFEELKDSLLNDSGEYSKRSIVRTHYPKWTTVSYYVEDKEFDPDKLAFIYNPLLEGLSYDHHTDEHHIFYGDDFLEVADECEEYVDYAEWGMEDKIIERSIDDEGGLRLKVLYSNE